MLSVVLSRRISGLGRWRSGSRRISSLFSRGLDNSRRIKPAGHESRICNAACLPSDNLGRFAPRWSRRIYKLYTAGSLGFMGRDGCMASPALTHVAPVEVAPGFTVHFPGVFFVILCAITTGPDDGFANRIIFRPSRGDGNRAPQRDTRVS